MTAAAPMQGTYIPQYTPVPPTAVPIEVSLPPFMQVGWGDNKSQIYASLNLLYIKKGLMLLYQTTPYATFKFGIALQISFSFFFFFLGRSAGALVFAFVLLCIGNGINHSWYFMYLGGEMGKMQENQTNEQTTNPKRFQKRRLQEGLMQSLVSVGNCWKHTATRKSDWAMETFLLYIQTWRMLHWLSAFHPWGRIRSLPPWGWVMLMTF